MATESKVTWVPEADGQHYLHHFTSLNSSWRLLLIADSHFEAPLLIHAFLNASHLRKEAKQRKITSREKHHALGKPSASPDEHKRPDLETDVLILLLHSLHCVIRGKETFCLGCNTPLFMIRGTVDQKDSNTLLIPFP